jgi:sugar (pentulose or hexulose) kinase
VAEFFVGVDFGTGGTKATLIDTQGHVLGYAFEEYPILTDKPGWSEHDASLYWILFCKMTKKLLLESGVNPAEIRGIAVSSALPSLVMVDQDNNPVQRAYNLMDRRATHEVTWLKEHIGEERIFKLTANRLEDHPSIVNLMWEKNNRPEVFKQTKKALTIDGFITLKLTGKATLNYSAAAFYGVAYNIFQRRFENDILELAGISPDLIPTLNKCDDIVGEITAQAAQETGLVKGTPVAGGQVDCNAGWLQGGAVEPGNIQMNLGTCGNFGIIHRNREFLFSEAGAASINFAYTVDSENTYITVPTTTTGGQTIRYIRDNFSQMEVEAEKHFGVDSYDLLNIQAEKVPLGSDHLIFLPYLMGERTPIWDVDARGVLFGLSLNHTKGHMVRAAMEGVAYALYHSYEVLSKGGLSIQFPMVLNEGGAKSKLWRRIITDVFNVQTVLLKRRTGAPFGDAILAGVATGVMKDFSVARDWAEYIDPMEPVLENHERYMEYFVLYKKLYQHIKEDYRALAVIRNR